MGSKDSAEVTNLVVLHLLKHIFENLMGLFDSAEVRDQVGFIYSAIFDNPKGLFDLAKVTHQVGLNQMSITLFERPLL